MKFNNKISQETVDKVKEILEQKEDKSEAIVEATELLMSAKYDSLVTEIVNESSNANAVAQNKQKLGLRNLTKEENDFYNLLKTDIRQAITGNQIDLIPNTIVDNTLADIKQQSDLLSLVTFAPANVKKWLVASSTGTYAWGKLTAGITGELSATFESMNIELGKLTAYLVIPKAIRELANEYVDKYFTAILNDVMHDGLENGFLLGTGVEQPIGVFRQIAQVETGGDHKMKTKKSTLTGFSPKQLAPVKTQLSHNGVRSIDGLVLICNPNDEATYVDPALYVQTAVGTYVQTAKDKIRVIATPNCPQGTAGIMIDNPKYYTMGLSAVQIKDYDQTKALDDADVVIAKVYGNGRALDDDVCYYFDPTKLEEFVPSVKTIAQATE